MFSIRQIIGDDWGSTSFSKWMRERAQLEIDYTSYGIPNAIVGLATDPWVDFDGDGDVDASDYSTFYSTHYAANDPEADRDADSDWDYFDVQFFLADTSAAGATLTPTGPGAVVMALHGHDRTQRTPLIIAEVPLTLATDPSSGQCVHRSPFH